MVVHLFRRPCCQFPLTFLMYTVITPLLTAIINGNVAIVSLRIGEFAELNVHSGTTVTCVRFAPKSKRYKLALLLIQSGGVHQYGPEIAYYIHKFDSRTVAAFIMLNVIPVTRLNIIRCIMPKPECLLSLAVLLTVSGRYLDQPMNYTNCNYATKLLYSFRKQRHIKLF